MPRNVHRFEDFEDVVALSATKWFEMMETKIETADICLRGHVMRINAPSSN
jgi:hypothetical protein